ncbi:MAG: DUF1223 domain-containing protein [Candidatus Omnitrophota bacterium]
MNWFLVDASAENSRIDGSRPFAVVELYTSEGCSSCPPADILLSQFTRESSESQQRIFTLGFHVDYWDYLGWPDAFARPEYSSRQRKYAQVQRSSSVYTPQMIINGIHSFGGNRSDQARKYIEEELKTAPKAAVHISSVSNIDRWVSFHYEIDPFVTGDWLNVAVVESALSFQVKRGENAGRTLEHDNVVRFFRSIPMEKNSGDVSVEIPAVVKMVNANVIIYVQDAATLQIKAANIINRLE